MQLIKAKQGETLYKFYQRAQEASRVEDKVLISDHNDIRVQVNAESRIPDLIKIHDLECELKGYKGDMKTIEDLVLGIKGFNDAQAKRNG